MLLQRECPFVPAGLLPLPAPLPSLTSALSRRAALFGAVAVTGALAASATVAVVPAALSANDGRLVTLAEELEAIEHFVETYPSMPFEAEEADYPDYYEALGRFTPLEDEVSTLEADTLAGVLTKIRILAIPTTAHPTNPAAHNIMVSITEDITRLHAAGALS